VASVFGEASPEPITAEAKTVMKQAKVTESVVSLITVLVNKARKTRSELRTLVQNVLKDLKAPPVEGDLELMDPPLRKKCKEAIQMR